MTHPFTHTHLHNMIFTEKKICQRKRYASEKDMPKICQRKRYASEKDMPDDLMHAIASLLLSIGWCTQKLGQSDYSVC